jgi:hypothetical protein
MRRSSTPWRGRHSDWRSSARVTPRPVGSPGRPSPPTCTRAYVRAKTSRIFHQRAEGTFLGQSVDSQPVEEKKGVAVQNDQSQRIPNAGQERGQHFELPVVREVRPDSPPPPDDSESADRSPSSSAGTETLWSKLDGPLWSKLDGPLWSKLDGPLWSKPDGPTGESTVAEVGDTFERRWEQVQTRFVGQAARVSRPQKRAPDPCVQPASQEA